jgi:hypothetical protein
MTESSQLRIGAKAPTAAALFLVFTVIAALVPTATRAGPCTFEIDRLEAAVDARSDTTASTRRMGRESTAGTEHRQPTPDSIAQAEESLSEGPDYWQVLAKVARAREADQVGDAVSCEQVLGAVRTALGR